MINDSNTIHATQNKTTYMTRIVDENDKLSPRLCLYLYWRSTDVLCLSDVDISISSLVIGCCVTSLASDWSHDQHGQAVTSRAQCLYLRACPLIG